MSVGDIAYDVKQDKYFMVGVFGFAEVKLK